MSNYTKITRAALDGKPYTGERNPDNRKPFRSKSQKAAAQKDARKCDDGTYRTNVPVSYHARTAQ